jgi:hypothetical protein
MDAGVFFGGGRDLTSGSSGKDCSTGVGMLDAKLCSKPSGFASTESGSSLGKAPQ